MPITAECEIVDLSSARRTPFTDLRAASPALELSPREAQIARLTCSGLSNKEIGRRLNISHHTVSTHLRRIFDKLGVNRRSRLAAVVAGGDSDRR